MSTATYKGRNADNQTNKQTNKEIQKQTNQTNIRSKQTIKHKQKQANKTNKQTTRNQNKQTNQHTTKLQVDVLEPHVHMLRIFEPAVAPPPVININQNKRINKQN